MVAEVGTLAPPGPPEYKDQLVVVDVSHVPAPPTQYLLGAVESDQPVLLTLLLLAPAYHVAPPVAVISVKLI